MAKSMRWPISSRAISTTTLSRARNGRGSMRMRGLIKRSMATCALSMEHRSQRRKDRLAEHRLQPVKDRLVEHRLQPVKDRLVEHRLQPVKDRLKPVLHCERSHC